jgi:hypothetical protein
MLSTTGLVDSVRLVKVLQVSNLCHHCTGEEVEEKRRKEALCHAQYHRVSRQYRTCEGPSGLKLNWSSLHDQWRKENKHEHSVPQGWSTCLRFHFEINNF